MGGNSWTAAAGKGKLQINSTATVGTQSPRPALSGFDSGGVTRPQQLPWRTKQTPEAKAGSSELPEQSSIPSWFAP